MPILSEILVVTIEQAVAAPYCSCRLADAGARAAFRAEVQQFFESLAHKYGTAAATETAGESFQLSLVCYPKSEEVS